MDKNRFAARLATGEPVVLDGGLATQLEAQGESIDTLLWSAALLRSKPSAIVTAHRAFLDAGAEIVISASYQASRAGFHQLGVDAAEADRLIASSVALARQACDEYAADNPAAPPRLVAASVGPYGAVLHDGSEYTGDYGVPAAVLRQFHAQRLALLDATAADVLACETIPSADEARVLAELLYDATTPAWVSFSCRNGDEISDGTALAEVAALFADHPRVLAVGINCTAPGYVVPLIGHIAAAAPDKAIVVYPNSGERYSSAGNQWSGETQPLGLDVEAWLAAGARLVGGCCRITPTQIRSMTERLHAPYM